MKKLTLMLCLVLFGCQTKEDGFLDAVQLPAAVSYIGSDINGELRECTPSSGNEVCTADFAPGDAFAEDCRERGFEPVSCGCHDYICLDRNVQTGFDINGVQQSCEVLSEDAICSMEFTIEDQFAFDCRDEGKEVIKCDCHKYLCK